MAAVYVVEGDTCLGSLLFPKDKFSTEEISELSDIDDEIESEDVD